MSDLYFSEDDIDRLIVEDLPYGDLTTRALGIGQQIGRMTFRTRHPLVLCGAGIAARLITRLGGTVQSSLQDGSHLESGVEVLTATGPVASLQQAWKISQTVVDWASGIATATNAIVKAVQSVNPSVRVACARKAPPGTRKLAIAAVQCGGAEMHRNGLSETILIFPEHLIFMGENAIADAIAKARTQAPERTVVIEVATQSDAIAAAKAGAHVVQLEKFTPQDVRSVVLAVAGKCLIAAAGGIKADNAAHYAEAGAQILVTSAPYSAPPAEIKVEITHP